MCFAGLVGCGGGAPLLHPAHVLPPGDVSVGAGVSGQLALKSLALPKQPTSQAGPNVGTFQDLAIAPGVAPWVSGRMGVAGGNEVGLTYAGREVRLDGRHAFTFGRMTLSTGLGASAVVAHQPGGSYDASGVFGGGADLPLLLGWRSTSDIYSLWFGPRAGFEILSGRLQFGPGGPQAPASASSVFDISARHFYGGLVAGIRVGFRHFHAAIELDATYHRATGSFLTSGSAGPGTSTDVQQLSLTPAGALEVSF